MSKSIVLAVLAEVFDIEMGGGGGVAPSSPYALPASLYLDEEHVVSNAMPRPRRENRGGRRRKRRNAPAATLSTLRCAVLRGIPKSCRRRHRRTPCVRVLFILRPLRSHSRRVATCLFTLRDRPRQISPTRYLLPVAIPPREHIKG